MKLYEKMMEEFTMLYKVPVPDGIGGFFYDWNDGATFQAAIVKNSTMEALIAEKQGVTEVFTVTFDRNLPIDYHDVFRRESDKAIFRATSNVTDSKTPATATFHFGQVSAERWKLS